jgi:hypothetical protein
MFVGFRSVHHYSSSFHHHSLVLLERGSSSRTTTRKRAKMNETTPLKVQLRNCRVCVFSLFLGRTRERKTSGSVVFFEKKKHPVISLCSCEDMIKDRGGVISTYAAAREYSYNLSCSRRNDDLFTLCLQKSAHHSWLILLLYCATFLETALSLSLTHTHSLTHTPDTYPGRRRRRR